MSYSSKFDDLSTLFLFDFLQASLSAKLAMTPIPKPIIVPFKIPNPNIFTPNI